VIKEQGSVFEANGERPLPQEMRVRLDRHRLLNENQRDIQTQTPEDGEMIVHGSWVRCYPPHGGERVETERKNLGRFTSSSCNRLDD
jgi:hypothetical protein